MKKLIGFISAVILAFGVSSFAQTTTDDGTKKRTENYGQQRSSEVNKGQQGEKVREQTRTENSGDTKGDQKKNKEQKKEKKETKKEAKEQKKEQKQEKKQQKQQESGKKGNGAQ